MFCPRYKGSRVSGAVRFVAKSSPAEDKPMTIHRAIRWVPCIHGALSLTSLRYVKLPEPPLIA